MDQREGNGRLIDSQFHLINDVWNHGKRMKIHNKREYAEKNLYDRKIEKLFKVKDKTEPDVFILA